MSLTRRHFLASLSLLVSALAVTPWRRAAASGPTLHRRLRIARRAIGRAYLATHPEDDDAQRLGLALAPITGSPDLHDNAAISFRADPVARAITADFAAGRTCRVQGWILSLTECRLCAAAALAA